MVALIVVVIVVLVFYFKRVYRNFRKVKLFNQQVQKYEDSIRKWGVVIGFPMNPNLAPIKIAALDKENKIKLVEMLKNVKDSKHEHFLYKEVMEPFDNKKYALIGPFFRKDDKFNVYDFRDKHKSPKVLTNQYMYFNLYNV